MSVQFFFITLKQRAANKIISIVNVEIAIVGVVLIYGREFENTKYVIIDAKKDKIIKKIVIFLLIEGFSSQADTVLKSI